MKKIVTILKPAVILSVFFILTGYIATSQETEAISFSFGSDQSTDGLTCNSFLPASVTGVKYGLSGSVIKKNTYCTTDADFAFWATRPEGNYLVKVVVGSETEVSNVTIKAEQRRLMIYDHTTAAGDTDTLNFVVNIRKPEISTGGSISLKTREYDYLNWDEYLTLEFGGDNPCIRSLTMEKVDVPTIFLTGNSTVTDQNTEPWASWGQMFPLFFKSNIAVANFAESGETLKAFEAEKRLLKVTTQIDTGDYMMMEFAHNDQKSGSNYVEPYTTYQQYLMKFADVATSHSATPVFVTSTNRRSFDSQGNINNTLGDYPDAMRQLGQKEGILTLDLNAMTKSIYEALGEEGSKKAFVHYPVGSFPFQTEAWADNTHFNYYGAWQLAKAVVEEIRTSDSPLKAFLKDDVTAYDPNKPDAFSSFKWPINMAAKAKLSAPLTLTCDQELSTDASLSQIKYSWKTVSDFDSSIYLYTVDLEMGTTKAPNVSATASDSRSTVEIVQADDVNGKATITVTAEDGTVLTYEIQFNVLKPLGVHANVLEIYPNPSNGIIHLKSEGVETVEILSVEGKLLYSQQLKGETQLDVSFLKKGVYLIKMISDRGTEKSKMIIE